MRKGNKHDVSNYRLASILTPFSKILEKIMQSRFRDHLKVNNKAIPAQAWTVQRVPGGLGNSRQSTHEGGKVVWIYLNVINKYQCS